MKTNYQEVFKEIRELHEKYQNTFVGRKELIEAIRQKINEVRKNTLVCGAELDDIERYYSYRDYYISDYQLVMRILLRLANENEDIYGMKEYTTTGYYNTGKKEVNNLFSKILVISENALLDNINDHLFYYDEFRKLASDSINNGNSMIVITTNLFEGNVKPSREEITCDNVINIRNGGLEGNITCYINNPSLQEAIDKLIDYIKVNGPDFTNIDEDTLYDLIQKHNKDKQKKLK